MKQFVIYDERSINLIFLHMNLHHVWISSGRDRREIDRAGGEAGGFTGGLDNSEIICAPSNSRHLMLMSGRKDYAIAD